MQTHLQKRGMAWWLEDTVIPGCKSQVGRLGDVVTDISKCLLFTECQLSGCGSPGGLVVKNPPVNTGDEGSVPG